MRLLILIVAIVLSVGKFSYAQATIFSKTYDFNNGNEVALSIIETKDGNFLYTGGATLNKPKALIVKINNLGDTLWSKRFDLSTVGISHTYSSVELSNGNFLLAGSLHDTATVTAKGYLMLISAQGDSLWVKQYGSGNGTNGDLVMSLASTPDGGFVVAGRIVLASSNFATTDAWVFKTDSLGNMLWQKQFNVHGLDDNFQKVVVNDDSTIVLGGETLSSTSTSKALLVKLKSNGDTIWVKEYGSAIGNAVFDLDKTTDKGYILAGATYDGATQFAYVSKIDGMGNSVWESNFARSNNPSHLYSFSAVHQMHDSNFIAAGADFDLTQTTITPHIRMFIVSASGDSLWSQQYAHSTGTNHDYLFDMKPTSDGGYIMCGYVIHNSPTNNDALVIKVDSIDCMNYVNGCQTVGVVPSPLERVGVRIYPNPTIGNVTIKPIEQTDETLTIEVYNMLGAKIITQPLSHTPINLSAYNNGIYLVRIVDVKGKQVFINRTILQKE